MSALSFVLVVCAHTYFTVFTGLLCMAMLRSNGCSAQRFRRYLFVAVIWPIPAAGLVRYIVLHRVSRLVGQRTSKTPEHGQSRDKSEDQGPYRDSP